MTTELVSPAGLKKSARTLVVLGVGGYKELMFNLKNTHNASGNGVSPCMAKFCDNITCISLLIGLKDRHGHCLVVLDIDR